MGNLLPAQNLDANKKERKYIFLGIPDKKTVSSLTFAGTVRELVEVRRGKEKFRDVGRRLKGREDDPRLVLTGVEEISGLKRGNWGGSTRVFRLPSHIEGQLSTN